MQSFKRVYIFSDLHLESPEQPLGQALLHTMLELRDSGDALVLAGDIFEILVGNSAYFAAKIAPFLDALRMLLERKVAIFYLEGNHDFHLSGLLPSGVSIPGDAIRIPVLDSSGKSRTLEVVHGDLVDPEDRAYLRMRRIFRSGPVRVLAGILPGRAIAAIAGALSRSHGQKASDLPEFWPAGRRERLRALYRADAGKRREHGADFVVMGHCHDLDDWGGFYWNMGYPPVHRQFLVYDPGGSDGKDSIARRYFLGK
jgi:UDP-2,3-diacylglucosamine hydrolase